MSTQRRTATGTRRTRGTRGASRRGTSKSVVVRTNGDGAATTEVASPAPSPVSPAATERETAAQKTAVPQEKRARPRQEQLTGWRLLVARLRKWYNETVAELRRVTWPDRETVRNLSVIVIVVSAFLGLLLGGIDYILLQIFEALT